MQRQHNPSFQKQRNTQLPLKQFDSISQSPENPRRQTMIQKPRSGSQNIAPGYKQNTTISSGFATNEKPQQPIEMD
jgi:hypothetical protein